MNFVNSFDNKLFKFQKTLIYLLPLALITGSFLPDLFAVLSSSCLIYFLIKNKKNITYFNNFFLKSYFSWFGYILIISLFSIYNYEYFSSSIFMFRFGFLVTSIYFISINDKNFEKNFFKFLLFPILFVSIDGIFQYFFNVNLLGFETNELMIGRISGVFKDEYILGSYLFRFIPILLGLYILNFSQNKIIKFFFIVTVLLSCISIFISGERIAIILTLFSFSFFLLFFRINIIKIFVIIFLTSILAFFIVKDNDIYKRLINDTSNQIILSSKGFDLIDIYPDPHKRIFKSAFSLVNSKNIFFGIGPKNFYKFCKDIYDVELIESSRILNISQNCSNHPHNIYLQSLVELGLVGTLPLVFYLFHVTRILFIAFIKIIKTKKQFNEFELYKLCLFHSIFLTLFPLATSGSLYNNWLNVIYAIPVGLLLKHIVKRH